MTSQNAAPVTSWNAKNCNRCRGSHMSNKCHFRNSTCHAYKKISISLKCASLRMKNPGAPWHNLQIEEEENKVPPVCTLFNILDMEETLPHNMNFYI